MDELAAIRRLLDEALASAAHPATRADTIFADQLQLDLELLVDQLAARVDGDASIVPAFAALARWYQDAVDALTEPLRELYLDWRFDLKNRVLHELGDPRARPLQGERIVPCVLAPAVAAALHRLRHRAALRGHAAGCDCAILVAHEWSQRPASQRLVRIGPASDGNYTGDTFLCEVCGRRWRKLHMDGSLGTPFWEPAP